MSSFFLFFFFFSWCLTLISTLSFSVISRRFLGDLPVLFKYLSWHQQVSRNAYPTILTAKEGNLLLQVFKVLGVTRLRIESVTWRNRGGLSFTPPQGALFKTPWCNEILVMVGNLLSMHYFFASQVHTFIKTLNIWHIDRGVAPFRPL